MSDYEFRPIVFSTQESENNDIFEKLDKAQDDIEDFLMEENKRLTKFIVRGLKKGKWTTFGIVERYSIQEAWRAANSLYEDPLIVIDLVLWNMSDENVKRNVEEIALATYKRKKEEAKGD